MPNPDYMTSQDHRDRARSLVRTTGVAVTHRPTTNDIAQAQVHATLALYEGMYELLGDGSQIQAAIQEHRARA